MAGTAKAIRIHTPGGPDVMVLEEVALLDPGPGEARVRHEAIGLNFLDVYHRSGLYPLPYPTGLGTEAAGVVEAIGAGVTEVSIGDRVAYAAGAPGAYATARVVASRHLVKLPESIPTRLAATAMLKGMTAEYLLQRVFLVYEEHTVLFHAAAGGVGRIACRFASKALNAKVIGTVGSAAKAEIARADGCQHVIDTSKEDFVARVAEITGGAGVDIVYDSVGKDTFAGSLECLKTRGTMVSFGQSSGPIPPFSMAALAKKSLFLTRPALHHYTHTRAELEDSAATVFAAVTRGDVVLHPPKEYPLARAADAHRDLEGRKTTGSSILVP